MGNPDWVRRDEYSTPEARRAHESELEEKIAEWTRKFAPGTVVERLQRAGVPSGMVNQMKDVYDDPQLVHRRQWNRMEHPEIGPMSYQRPPFTMSGSPSGPDRPDPLLGEHNEHFYRELLGLSEAEFEELTREGVID